MGGLVVMAIWLFLAIAAPYSTDSGPDSPKFRGPAPTPNRDYIFGTDDLGRDMVSRIIWGARVSVPAGILVIAFTSVFGCLMGAIAGYLGGVDR